MIGVSKIMSDKDSENKNITLKVLAIVSLAIAVVSGGVIAAHMYLKAMVLDFHYSMLNLHIQTL